MRELSVYYCPKCGRYAYYQLVKNTICPNCDVKMIWLNMRYQDFMDLTLEERDDLIINELLKRHQSYTGRLIAADRAHNYRATVASLTARVQQLEADNKELSDTVDWMHKTIWDLLGRNKALEQQLSGSSDDVPAPSDANQKPD